MQNKTDSNQVILKEKSLEPRLAEDLAAQRPPSVADTLFEGNLTIPTLLESLAEGVVIVDPAARILMINRKMEALFGYSREELVGRPLNTLIPARLHAPHQDHVKNYFANPRSRPMGEGRNLVGCRKNGREFPVEISLSHLHTSGLDLAIAFVTDITLRVQAENALKIRNEELDDFAHTVAHDLKGSLTALIGHSELLGRSDGNLEAKMVSDSLEQIHKSSQKMAQIIDELLFLASVRKEDVNAVPLDMRTIISEALQRLELEGEDRTATILLADHFPKALGHAPWVEEVWYNYIANALRYGGTPAKIEIGAVPRQDGMVEFWVQDNGAGLTDEEQAHLFTPYALRNSKPGGHGLGLSIVRRIVEKLNGQVGVASRVDAGSRFSFTLPAP